MGLSFPNSTRTYDEDGDCVRFVGHDGPFQISFSISVDALKSDAQNEASYLRAFDTALTRIRGMAATMYGRTRKNHYRLSAADL